ncbi:restriction endonuclease [Klebsiella variicola]|nr:restriction endonuclease [Klebsiella variicola]
MFPFPTTENLILWACSAIALFAVVFFRRSVRNRRHKRKQQSARRVLERIKTLPGFPQKINYLRKIDPFVFEELLLEGFEAHGFRTIRNKRYTGDGGIDGQVIIGVNLDIENYCTLRSFFDLPTLAGRSRRNLPEAGIRLLFQI